jgi:hypothetical protein
VSDGYFESLRVPLVTGRGFGRFDTTAGTPVVVVNETFARRYFAGRAAVGHALSTSVNYIGPLGVNLFRLPPDTPTNTSPPLLPATGFEIIGVAQDVRNAPLGQPVEPAVYFSTRQFPFRAQYLAIRASSSATALAALRTALRNVAPAVPLGRTETWGERFARAAAEPRLLMAVLTAFAGLAGLLAAVGVYGLFSWSVAFRSRELAIRLALGAEPARIGRLVVRQSAFLALSGVAAGLLLVRVAEGTLARVLYEIAPTDLTSTVIASVLLLTTALAACAPAALRAMRVDPARGLRTD